MKTQKKTKEPEILIGITAREDGQADLRFRFDKSKDFGMALSSAMALNPKIRERVLDLSKWLADVATLSEGVEKVRGTKKPRDRFF